MYKVLSHIVACPAAGRDRAATANRSRFLMLECDQELKFLCDAIMLMLIAVMVPLAALPDMPGSRIRANCRQVLPHSVCWVRAAAELFS